MSVQKRDQSVETPKIAGTLISGAPFQLNQVAGLIAKWPHYSDTIVDIPYPPNWYYEASQMVSSGTIEEISFWEKAGGSHGSDGGLIEVDKNPIAIADEQYKPQLMSEGYYHGYAPPNEYRVPNKSYPAVAYDASTYEFEYSASVDEACGDYIMHAQIYFIPGEEPRSQSSTLALHAMVSGIKMKQCEKGTTAN